MISSAESRLRGRLSSSDIFVRAYATVLVGDNYKNCNALRDNSKNPTETLPQNSLSSPGPHWRIFKTTSEIPDYNGQWDNKILTPPDGRIKIELDDFQMGLDYVTVGDFRNTAADRERLRAFSAWARDEASREHGWERHMLSDGSPVGPVIGPVSQPTVLWESTTMPRNNYNYGPSAGGYVYHRNVDRNPNNARSSGVKADTYNRDLWKGIGHWTVARSLTQTGTDRDASRSTFDPTVQKLMPKEGPLYLPGSSTPFSKNPPPYQPGSPSYSYTPPYRPGSVSSPQYSPHGSSKGASSGGGGVTVILLILGGVGLLVALVSCAACCSGSKRDADGRIITDPNFGTTTLVDPGAQPNFRQPPGPYYPGSYGATAGLYTGSNVVQPGGASFRGMPMYGRPMGAPMGIPPPGMMMRPGGFPGQMPGQMPPGPQACGGGGMTSSQAAAVYGS